MTAWLLSARVVNYGVEIETEHGPRVILPGAFAHSLARWWIPLMSSHARFLPLGRAIAYNDSEEGLDVDFVLADNIDVDFVLTNLAGAEFSIGYGADMDPISYGELHEVSFVGPGRHGACPNTGLLDVRQVDLPPPTFPSLVEASSRVERRPAPKPWWDVWKPALEKTYFDPREVYGEERDDWDPVDFWTTQSQRARGDG